MRGKRPTPNAERPTPNYETLCRLVPNSLFNARRCGEGIGIEESFVMGNQLRDEDPDAADSCA
jgi:hypothetical protein